MVFILFQREKDDALNEMDAMRDRLDITQASHNRLLEEKDITTKELERVLEKYDRLVQNIVLYDNGTVNFRWQKTEKGKNC